MRLVRRVGVTEVGRKDARIKLALAFSTDSKLAEYANRSRGNFEMNS